jgi:hypothetical protein
VPPHRQVQAVGRGRRSGPLSLERLELGKLREELQINASGLLGEDLATAIGDALHSPAGALAEAAASQIPQGPIDAVVERGHGPAGERLLLLGVRHMKSRRNALAYLAIRVLFAVREHLERRQHAALKVRDRHGDRGYMSRGVRLDAWTRSEAGDVGGREESFDFGDPRRQAEEDPAPAHVGGRDGMKRPRWLQGP